MIFCKKKEIFQNFRIFEFSATIFFFEFRTPFSAKDLNFYLDTFNVFIVHLGVFLPGLSLFFVYFCLFFIFKEQSFSRVVLLTSAVQLVLLFWCFFAFLGQAT
jgi:hypothetical protein